MKRTLMSLVVGLMVLGLVHAAPINFPTAGVKIDTPKGWNYEIAADKNSITISSPDDLVAISFVPLDAKSLDAALNAAEEQITSDVPDVEFGDAEKLKINGLDAVEVVGTGTLDDTPVTVSVSIIIGKKPIMVLAYISEGGEKYDKALTTFVQTIKKL